MYDTLYNLYTIMKIFQKLLIIAWMFFFWLLCISKADMISGPQPMYKYDNFINLDNAENLSWYKAFYLSYNWWKWWNNKLFFKEIKNYDCFYSPLYLINESNLNFENINTIYFQDYSEALYFLSSNDIIIKEYKWSYSCYTWKSYREITYHLEENNWINAIKQSVQKHGTWNCKDGEEKFYDGGAYYTYCVDWDPLRKKSFKHIIYWISAEKYTKKIEWQNRYQQTKQQIKYTLANFECHGSPSMCEKVITNFFKSFFKSLILTIILETIMLFFICKIFWKKDVIKIIRIILTWIFASTITLPILRFVLPYIFHNYTIYAVIGEVFVTFVEVFIIKYLLDINRQKSTIASIACNLFSVIIGLLL